MRKFASAGIACVSLLGCSVHPLQEDVTQIRLIDIVHKVRCEAGAAINQHAPEKMYDKSALAVQFTFSITENNDATSDADLTVPIHLGSIKVALSAGDKKKRLGERIFKIVDSFEDLRILDCRDVIVKESWRYPITGTTGLEEVIGNFIRLAKSGSTIDSYTDQIAFTTKINGSVKPSIALTPSPGRIINANVLVSGDREDQHKMLVTLELPKKKKPKEITEVRIVGFGPTEKDLKSEQFSKTPSTTIIQRTVQPPSSIKEDTKERALRNLDRERDLRTQELLLDRLRQ